MRNVQTQHQVLKRGGLYWDRDLLPRAVFDERFAAVQSALSASGDDAWLVYGDAQGYGDIAYVSHFLPRLRSVLGLVVKDAPPSLLANVGLRDIPASKTLTWFEDVRPFSRLPGEAVKLVRERGLDGARIGLVGTRAALPVAEWDAIAADLPDVTWVERDDAFRALRARKDRAELGAVALAFELARSGLRLAQAVIQPGKTVRQAAALIDREMRMHAAEDVRLLVASGPQCGIALRPVDDRLLAQGDAVMLYLAVEVQRHWAVAAQTYVLGAPVPAQRALIEKAAAAVAAMEAAARPGEPVASIAEAAERAIGDDVLVRSARAYGLGSGIGLDQEETPRISRESTEKAGGANALALHVVLQRDGLGAVAARTIFLDDKA
jgi:Xaa-Pro aminopeptidase